ncbi:YlmC/YmxH family sporulation protein [Oceanobacillus halotolerans]|uniref:YlmC/YmxH family sporulation protein n=1 Tax=Oceanobacillus halotolerans TaxID=2663380 RepID=UPI0013DD6D9F|nr:YlmC/YmxH family sporulation protein [Oceanobacillus halotolerans]
MVTLTELQMKEVIVIEDGKRLGHISDLEIDGDRGKIISLIIAIRDKKANFFAKGEEIFIHWNQIVTIGHDVILVKDVNTPQLYPENSYPE